MKRLQEQFIIWTVILAIALGLVWLGYAAAKQVHSVHCDCGCDWSAEIDND